MIAGSIEDAKRGVKLAWDIGMAVATSVQWPAPPTALLRLGAGCHRSGGVRDCGETHAISRAIPTPRNMPTSPIPTLASMFTPAASQLPLISSM